jgi:hypothetical protein
MCLISLETFKIFPLSMNLGNFITMCLGIILFLCVSVHLGVIKLLILVDL